MGKVIDLNYEELDMLRHVLRDEIDTAERNISRGGFQKEWKETLTILTSIQKKVKQ